MDRDGREYDWAQYKRAQRGHAKGNHEHCDFNHCEERQRLETLNEERLRATATFDELKRREIDPALVYGDRLTAKRELIKAEFPDWLLDTPDFVTKLAVKGDIDDWMLTGNGDLVP